MAKWLPCMRNNSKCSGPLKRGQGSFLEEVQCKEAPMCFLRLMVDIPSRIQMCDFPAWILETIITITTCLLIRRPWWLTTSHTCSSNHQAKTKPATTEATKSRQKQAELGQTFLTLLLLLIPSGLRWTWMGNQMVWMVHRRTTTGKATTPSTTLEEWAPLRQPEARNTPLTPWARRRYSKRPDCLFNQNWSTHRQSWWRPWITRAPRQAT